jgi:hypothetical protein
MSWNLEYDLVVERANWTMSVVVALLALAASAAGQINAAPPSVTSLGFGGHLFNGPFPSVTSLGPRGYTPGFNPAYPNSRPIFGWNSFSHHHHRDSGFYPVGGVYAAPYAVPYSDYYDPGNEAENDPADPYDNGAATRGRGMPPRAQSADAQDPAPASVSPPAPSEADPLVSQPATVLVFKDGRQLEIENYAIVGNTLYDLSGGARHKIPLADLDLGATVKQNDERGIDFRVPVGT